jgi:hypothetical protein
MGMIVAHPGSVWLARHTGAYLANDPGDFLDIVGSYKLSQHCSNRSLSRLFPNIIISLANFR